MKKNLTKQLTMCALLVALQVVLARLLIPMPNEFTRFSIEAVPVFLAGMLYGPLYGGMVGFLGDLVGTLFSGFGYNPMFCLPPILYGVCAGLFRPLLRSKGNPLTIALAFLPPVVLGSVLWQSFALAFNYGTEATLWQSYVGFLAARSIQFAVTYVLDVLILVLLHRSVLLRMGFQERKGTTQA